jgi:dTDP-4-dehydrorhamnose reductase
MVVLVTGGNGQLGQALQAAATQHNDLQFYFASSAEADVASLDSLNAIFTKVRPDFCINAAAYTAVDKAENEPDAAYAVNVTGAKNCAEVCKDHNTILLHVSTDFVFDGSKTQHYNELDVTSPQSVYGTTKQQGELEIEKALDKHYIVRTSWLYSQYGNNFLKTMLRLGAERDELSVVNDQIGTPTNANDLASALISIIDFNIVHPREGNYGTYHYSNEGQCTWYDFAKKIFELNNNTINLKPIPTSAYPTPAKRPVYSVLSKEKIKSVFNLNIKDWEESLKTQLLNHSN